MLCKTKHIVVLMLFVFGISFSQQSPNGINYKAIVKDSNSNAIANQNVTVQFSILQGVAQTRVYQETHLSTTDDNGVVIINIGEGTTNDEFTDIDWSADDHFLNTQINTGNGLIDVGTTQFMYVPYAIHAENVKGLEALDEGNGIGWRLIDRTSTNYGNIGQNAVDLSYSNSGLIEKGALGLNSFATGFFTTASGDYSTSMGFNSEAEGDYSTSLGFNTETPGDYALASGHNSSASGDYSSSLGYFTNASGLASTAMSYSTIALGNYSTAMGRNINAESYAVTSIGRYNLGGGNATTWNNNDPLFEIGNGASDSDRSNALTVYKNGRMRLNSSSSGLEVISEGFIGLGISGGNDNGLFVYGGSNRGIFVIGANQYGGHFTGNDAGIYADSATNANPDIILGGDSGNPNDDGIIASDPSYSSSDIYLRSNDAVIIELDDDNNESGRLIVRNADDNNVFTVDESGDVEMGSNLQLGPLLTLEGFLNAFVVGGGIFPNQDDFYQLGSPSSRWETVYSTNGVIQTSDIRSKTNIANLNYGLAEVLQMQPVSFNWKNKNNPDTKLGLIAQDIQNLIPEVVHSHIWEKDETSGELTKKELDRLGVYYSDLVPVLIKAIQEQNKIIDKQNKNHTSLLERVEILEAKTSN